MIAMLMAASAAFLVTIFGTPFLITQLRKRGIGQQIRDDGPIEHPHAAKDEHGRLRVGAAVGPSADMHARVAGLLHAGCDIICVDTAHGHSKGVVEAMAEL